MKPFTEYSLKEIDTYLAQEFSKVDWIGQIPLEKPYYEHLCKVARDTALRRHKIDSDALSPRLLLTTMVFTARYAVFQEDETPAFWKAYARMVWDLSEADQSFQSQFRQAFRKARNYVEFNDKLTFPHKIRSHDQETVSGIYRHAVLPSYLEDDFARWLIDVWQRGETWAKDINMPTRVRAATMYGHASLDSKRRRLRLFIEQPETRETAARLVETMAIGAEEVLHGKSADDVAQMLSLVEAAVWREFHQEWLAKQTSTGEPRKQKHTARLDWAWELENGDLALQVKSFSSPSGAAPDRLVWAVSDSASAFATSKCYVDVMPWQTAEGWLVEQAILDEVQGKGFVALVDANDSIVSDILMTPPLPQGAAAFFRIKDDDYAVLTPYNRVTNGTYLISHAQGLRLRAKQTNQWLEPQRVALLPALSQDYAQAGRYMISLPVEVIPSNTDESFTLYARVQSLTAVLEGPRLEGVTPLLNVFTRVPQLRLLNARPLEQEVREMVVRLVTANGTWIEERLDAQKQSLVGDDLLFSLETLLGKQVGVYTLTLQRRMARVLSEPLQFTLLPEESVRVEGPSPDGYYSQTRHPQVVIQGRSLGGVYTEHGTVQKHENKYEIEWHQPLTPVRVSFKIDGTVIGLEWPIVWHHVWIDPPAPDATLSDLDMLTLHFRGARYQNILIDVGEQRPRKETANAKGEFAVCLGQSQIKDMLRNVSSLKTPVKASDGHTTWPLFVFHRAIDDKTFLSPLARRAYEALHRVQLQKALDTKDIAALLALPPQTLNGLWLEKAGAVNPLIKALKTVHTLDITRVDAAVRPQTYPLRLELVGFEKQISLNVSQPSLEEGSGSSTIFIEGQEIPLTVQWSTDEQQNRSVTLHPRKEGDRLFLCTACHQFFIDDKISRMAHSHQRGWGAKHQSCADPLPITIHVDTEQLLHEFSPSFKQVIDRSQNRSLRIRKDIAKTKLPAPFWTPQGYTYAVAAWSQAMGTVKGQTALKTLIAPSTQRDVEKWIDVLSARQSPALVLKMLAELLSHIPSDKADSPNYHSDIKSTSLFDDYAALDPMVLVTAFLLRAAAYDPLSFPLNDREIDWIAHILDHALAGCPDLLAWGFSWVEFYFSLFHPLYAEEPAPL